MCTLTESVHAMLSTVHFIQTFLLSNLFMAKKKWKCPIENGCLFMLLRTKHLYFQADNIFKQTPFTLNKIKSPWFSIFMFYSVWKHNRNDNVTLMYSDLMTRFVLISCYIFNTIEYSKPQGDVDILNNVTFYCVCSCHSVV